MAKMTPLQFAQRYLNLDTYIFPPDESVELDYTLHEGWRKFRIAQYHLSDSAWFGKFWADISARAPRTIDVRIRTINGKPHDVSLSQKDAKLHCFWPFFGKGTPEEAQIAIQLVYRYHKTTMPPEAFVKLPGFIGLDCNGFVGSYIQRVVHEQTWQGAIDKQPSFGGAGTHIKSLFEATVKLDGREITDLDDMKSEGTYVLALCDPNNGTIRDPSRTQPKNYGHVMITEPNTLSRQPPSRSMADRGSAGVGLTVVQSSGGVGLHGGDYTLHSPSKQANGTVFTLSGERGRMPVRVALLKV